MKRIALLKRDAARAGGLEKYANRIAQAFQAKGNTVTLVGKERLYHPCNFGKVKEYNTYCHQFLLKNPHDIVLSFERTTFQTHLRAGNGVHAAYLDLRRTYDPWWKKFSLPLNPLHKTVLAIEKEAFESRELIKLFVNSYLVRDQILSYYRTDPAKVVVMHNGVEWHEMETAFSSWQEKRGCFELLFIGHNFERKGLKNLLQALALLPTRDFHLSVIGEDKHEAFFRRLTHALQLEKNVSFLGHQSSIIPFYQKADALVIPSLYDPFANVTLEALAMGLFVLSSPMNGGHEVLQPHSGMTIDPFNLESFSHALEEAMKRPKTLKSATSIRESVRHLDFSSQLSLLCEACLS